MGLVRCLRVLLLPSAGAHPDPCPATGLAAQPVRTPSAEPQLAGQALGKLFYLFFKDFCSFFSVLSGPQRRCGQCNPMAACLCEHISALRIMNDILIFF